MPPAQVFLPCLHPSLGCPGQRSIGASEGDKWPYLNVLESPPAPDPLHLVLLAPTPPVFPRPHPHLLSAHPFLAVNMYLPGT